jgi:hypothetical protein
MLIDSLLTNKVCAEFSKQLVCISSILFVIKLERDFNENMQTFFKFLTNKMKITPQEVYKCECFILSAIPENFGLLVGFTEMLKSYLSILGLASVSENEMNQLSNLAIDMYIKGECKLSIENNLIVLLIKSIFPKNSQEKKKLKLLAGIKAVNQSESNRFFDTKKAIKTIKISNDSIKGF